jgi:hypothetical protein
MDARRKKTAFGHHQTEHELFLQQDSSRRMYFQNYYCVQLACYLLSLKELMNWEWGGWSWTE